MVNKRKQSAFTDAALQHRLELAGKGGPKAIMHNLRVFGIVVFACIGGLLYGYNQGVFSGILTMPAFESHMGNYVKNQTKKGWLTSILELGAWLGTMYSGFLAEIISRKYAIIVNTCVFIIGVIVQCTAQSAGHNAILGGRFVVGMGVGSLSMIIPMVSSQTVMTDVGLIFPVRG
jgi:MFS family permease